MFKYAALLAAVSIAPAVLAQSQAYGQCGGKGWSGATTCVTGWTCTVSNEYYSQCLPGAATTSTRPITTSSTTTRSTSSTTTRPVSTSSGTTSAPSSTTTGGTTPAPNGNPYTGRSVYVSPYYAAEVEAAAATITDASLKAKYAKIQNTPTFIWFDVAAKVPDLKTYVADAKSKNQVLQIVVYDLPERDCAALSSNGELTIANGGVAKYKQYIDDIAAAIKGQGVTVVAVVEPDSLANLVTNTDKTKCANAASTYRDLSVYAMKTLNDAGVYMYLDAGHAGWLGYPDNLSKAAVLFAELYKLAGSPKYVRGFATNVSNYNALSAATPDPITSGNNNYDELHYIRAFAPALANAGFPAHFIVDQSRSGAQNIRSKWGDWCNIKGAGFGTRPTTTTPDSLIDAIVWVKPGGESDGTSDQTSKRYDSTCGLSDAFQPAPEAGTWFQAYFNALVVNASPSL